jgi:hypothetical protein
MRKIVYLILMVLLSVLSHAQEIDIQWGKEEKVEPLSMPYELLGIQNEKIFVLKSSGSWSTADYFINVYKEESLDKIQTLEFSKMIPTEASSRELFGVYLLKNNIVVLTIEKGKLYGIAFDYNGEMTTRDMILDVGEKENIKTVKGKIQMQDPFNILNVLVIPDRTQLLIHKEIMSKDKKSAAYSFLFFDGSLNKLHDYQHDFAYGNKQFSVSNARIDDDGTFYALAHIYKEKEKRESDMYQTLLISFSINEGVPTLKETKLDLKETIPTAVSLILFKDKIIVAGMMCAKDEKYRDMNGTIWLEMDKKALTILSSDFSWFKPGLKTRKMIFTGGSELRDFVDQSYHFKSYHINESNEKILVFENMETSILNYTGHGQTILGSYKNQQAGDIVIIKLNAQNKLEWNEMVNKFQIAMGPVSGRDNNSTGVIVHPLRNHVYAFVSFNMVFKQDKLYLIFNDDIENGDDSKKTKEYKPLFKPYYKSTDEHLSLVAVDLKSGKQKRSAIFSLKEARKLSAIGNSVKVKDNKIFLHSFYETTSSVGYLTLD